MCIAALLHRYSNNLHFHDHSVSYIDCNHFLYNILIFSSSYYIV